MIRFRVLVVPSLILVGFFFWFQLYQPLGWLSAFAIPPAIWVAMDSKRLRVTEYDTSLNYRPGVLLLLALAFPIVVVPWYLTVRDLIRSGRALHRATAAKPAV